jgi:hypothetical protein
MRREVVAWHGQNSSQKADFSAFSVTASKHKIAFLTGLYYCQQLASL